jgi:hypothetical protein
MVGMDMGFENMGDLHPVFSDNIQIFLHIPLGVDHTGHLCPGTPDDIGKTTHSLDRYLFEIHARILLVQHSESM